MPRDSPEKNTPRRLFGNSAGYSADSVVACVLPKKMQEVNEMANVKMIAPQTFQPEHMRVAAYCRVSSDSKDQLHSYAAQIRSYTEEIAQHDGWELVDVYADEGLTGTRMDKREDFNRMMRDCRKGKIDRVLVKSVSRFARNTKDCLSALRELSTLGVSVQFEKENIDTKTLTTELMVSVSGSLAQQESISISANQKISYQRRMERGEFITCSAPYGYRIIDKKNLEIIPEEATTVQWIFDAYLNGRSAEWIADQLTRRGIENTNTRKPWTAYGIRYILRNEKYIGDALGQKKFTKGFPFFRKRNHGEQEQYYVENTHLPIIEREQFEKVQNLLQQKAKRKKPTRSQYSLTRKIICEKCGTPFIRRETAKGLVTWVCRTHDRNAANCPMGRIPETEIHKATLTFKMIMMLAMYIIETNPYIKQALQMTYSFVFLDEFQDTTAIQYAFVKECFWNSGTKVTSVGDNKQRIMVWAGAVKTIFNDFYRELNPKCIRLIMNHRSAPRLVALQKAMYESLKEKATEVCASGNWAEDDGNIALFIADNEQLEAAAVSKDILLKISNGVEPHDICILCKQKPQDYASAIIEELEKHGVRARIETGYQDLIKEPIVDLFIKFMICADSRKHPNEWTFIEELLVELWGISGMRENDTFDEMQRKLSAVVNVVKKNIQQKLDTEQWHSTLNSIIDFFGIGNIKAKFPAYKQGTYFMNVINQFESLFFEEYVAAHGVWNLAIENFRGDHSVPIMTIHKSKGLEYNAVYFIGLEDSAFWNFRNQPDEDRCTFFVALSRAKASVTFTFCKKRTGMKCPMQRHNAINEFFDLLQRPGIAEVKRFQNR